MNPFDENGIAHEDSWAIYNPRTGCIECGFKTRAGARRHVRPGCRVVRLRAIYVIREGKA